MSFIENLYLKRAIQQLQEENLKLRKLLQPLNENLAGGSVHQYLEHTGKGRISRHDSDALQHFGLELVHRDPKGRVLQPWGVDADDHRAVERSHGTNRPYGSLELKTKIVDHPQHRLLSARLEGDDIHLEKIAGTEKQSVWDEGEGPTRLTGAAKDAAFDTGFRERGVDAVRTERPDLTGQEARDLHGLRLERGREQDRERAFRAHEAAANAAGIDPRKFGKK